jgi:Restriction endonuclease
MTKSKDLNKYAKEIYFDIVTSFSPTNYHLNINDKIDEFDKAKSLFFSTIEHDSLLASTKRMLAKYIDARKEKGSISKFEFSKSDSDFIIGIAKLNPVYSVFPEIVRYMTRMADNDFEKFSGKYIQLHFSDFAFVTRKSGDGGIDFLGNGIFKKFLNLSGTQVDLKNKTMTFKIIGQSKRYKPENAIGPKEIREFLGSVKILQEALHPNKESAWLGQKEVLNKIKLADPFIYTFLTTSYYSEDAVSLANKLGIYIYDIDDMVFDLIENSIGIISDKFNVVAFETWCRK